MLDQVNYMNPLIRNELVLLLELFIIRDLLPASIKDSMFFYNELCDI